MKKTTSISLLIGTFIATGLSATVATAKAPDQQWNVKDHTATGSAFLYDDCQSTSVDISGSESSTHSGGGAPVNDNGAWAGYYAYNWCTGSQTSGFVWVPGGFDGDMNEASIDVVFEAESYEYLEVDGEWVYSFVGTSTVEINAQFVGVGQAENGRNMSMSRWGNSYSRSRWSGQWREATLDLSVTVDGNSVDLQDAVGSLGKSKSGSISVYE